MTDLDRSAAFWDREHREPQYHTWMERPLVREAINRRIGGERPRWPVDWFVEWNEGRVFRRALSIGCGTGVLERGLVERGFCRSVDAFDISLEAVAQARTDAHRAGVGGAIRYFAADFNRISLPGRCFDLILFHQSLHHVDALERLLGQVLGALEPHGLLFLDEYVGPSRTWWTPRRFRTTRGIYDALPEQYRTARPKLLLPIQADDPSEAVRSGEIRTRLRTGFDIAASRPYGGNLLAPISSFLAGDTPDEIIRDLLEREERLMGEGSYYELIVARPRPGRRLAKLRYRAGALAHELLPKRSYRAARAFARRVWVAVDRRVRRKPIEHYI